MRVSERRIHDFVTLNKDWVLAASDKVKKNKQDIKSLAPKAYNNGERIPFKGEQITLQLQTCSSDKIQIKLENQLFVLSLPEAITDQNKHSLIRQELIDWMKKQAAIEAKNTLDIYAKKYNLYPRYIRIKTQKSRWGSCGIYNDINLNWLLILAPPKIMEYVLIHELCHIKERNHSADFWSLVEQHCPDYRNHRRWLKQNGRSLMQGL